MAFTTPYSGLPYPAPGDAPDGAGAIAALATALDGADVSASITYLNSVSSGDPERTFLAKVVREARLIFNTQWPATAVSVGTQLLQLPDSCRPRFPVYFTAWIYRGGWLGPGLFKIDSGGGVYPQFLPSGGSAAVIGANGVVEYPTLA